jgi:hypothetical protein
MAGISIGGIIVIVGIVIMLIWSLWIGLIVALVGLVAFGASPRGSGTDLSLTSPRRPGRGGSGVPAASARRR